jgi:nitroimidazol reductase NimA-like FMN-containing flavoprotein (pyridoxamine 5'-phosphate oxidase superfamily)
MTADQAYVPTARTVPTRYRERARYDHATVHGILDEALICHVGFIGDDGPVVLPTIHTRLGETLYLHGSTGSHPMIAAAGAPGGLPVCVTATLIDGLVLARSWMHHSLEYRSVVAVGNARSVRDDDEKRRALASVVDHVALGRSADSRPPDARELAATAVIALDLAEVSAKVRTGGPADDEDDMTLPHWAGVLPLTLQAGTPIPSGDLNPSTPPPAYLTDYHRS